MARGLIVAAAASHSGKTLVSMGLIAALRAKGLKVAAAKCGPDYIDPKFLAAASGSEAINLDPWAMPAERLAERLARQADGADIIVVEGVMGLYDGGAGGVGSTASLAALTGLHVVLVVSAQGLAQTAAAVAEGCVRLAEKFRVAGAIVNQVASERHADLIREGFSRTSVPLLGIIRRDASITLPSRHLGLVQAEEDADLAKKIRRACELVVEGCQLDVIAAAAHPLPSCGGETERGEGHRLNATFSHGEKVAAEQPDEGLRRQRILASAATPHPSPLATPSPSGRGLAAALPPLGQRIAIARDVAFAFSYPHLLNDWREQGAEISFFSPLADEAPSPQAGAIYLPGGYPELYAGKIAAAKTFRTGMEAAAKRNALIYGECGGYMVLGDSLVDAEGVEHPMLGMLALSTSFRRPKLHLGYRRLEPIGDRPWSAPIAAHEFHYASVVSEGDGDPLFTAQTADGAPLGPIGLRRGCIMGSFAHVIDTL